MTDDAPTWYLQGICKNKNKNKKIQRKTLRGCGPCVTVIFDPFLNHFLIDFRYLRQ